MSFKIYNTFIHLQNTNEDFILFIYRIWEISALTVFCDSLPFWGFRKLIKGLKTNPCELSDLDQISWRDSITLYDELI